jgi:spoIIIJ-associated protein
VETETAEEATSPEEPTTGLLEREGDAAADYLEALLDIADLDGDIDIDVEGNRAMVSVVEVNAGELAHLVGEDGEILDALQELTRLAASRDTGERSRLMLDIAGHRAAKRAVLEEAAKVAIAEAQRTAAPVRMVPMTAFERKVVHDAVAAAGLVSESDGQDPDRCVVIRLP